MRKRFLASVPWFLYITMVCVTCIILSAGSCTFTSEGLSIISGDYTSPTLEHFLIEDETKAVIQFSHKVSFPKLDYYVLNNASEIQGAVQQSDTLHIGSVSVEGIGETTMFLNDNKSVFSYILNFPIKTEAHLQYILSGIVKDEVGSTLSFTLSFSGYNSRVPRIIFSEICTEYSKPRTEFVEFYVLEDGNLAGVMLQSASDGIPKDYTFPSVEVKKGEYVVLHMRTLEEGAVNELESDLSLSNTKQSSSTGRDLWIAGAETRLPKNDVLLLRSRQNGSLLDAVAYTDGTKEDWPKDSMLEYITEASLSNLWQGGTDVLLAANIEKTTATRTFCRQNVREIASWFDKGENHWINSKDDWIIVDTSNLTPGSENSSVMYSK